MNLIDVFIIILLCWFWCWDLPADLPTKRLIGYGQAPFLWLELWHNWSMFAPEPLHVHRRLKAVIRYADGSVHCPIGSRWLCMRSEDLPPQGRP